MKIPPSPPSLNALNNLIAEKGLQALLPEFDRARKLTHYDHWDKIRFQEPPAGLTREQWWGVIRLSRNYRTLETLTAKDGSPFRLTQTDHLNSMTHQLDRLLGFSFISEHPQTKNPENHARIYLKRDLFEEAISSSQLEGATTTREVARKMLREHRPPRDKSEQMIANNYSAMEYLQTWKGSPLTQAFILELHRTLTEKTIPADQAGRFRTPDEPIEIGDGVTGETIFTPPAATEIQEQMDALIAFANTPSPPGEPFLHPILRAIILHFMLAYIHPFTDGNGRTARALFYWYLLHHNYWTMRFISISTLLKKHPADYTRSYLYTETDFNDLTYFMNAQLDILLEVATDFKRFIEKKISEEAEFKKYHETLNDRQIALLSHSRRHPGYTYTADEHAKWHGITLNTARSDLKVLATLKLLTMKKEGKTQIYQSKTISKSVNAMGEKNH